MNIMTGLVLGTDTEIFDLLNGSEGIPEKQIREYLTTIRNCKAHGLYILVKLICFFHAEMGLSTTEISELFFEWTEAQEGRQITDLCEKYMQFLDEYENQKKNKK